MILPPEAISRRISRIQALVAYLERIEAVDLSVYTSNIALQLRIERVLQLALQAAIDVGETLMQNRPRGGAGASAIHPSGTSEAKSGATAKINPATATDSNSTGNLFDALAVSGILSTDLAQQIGDLPSLTEVLIHEHIEIDHTITWKLWRERRKDLSAIASAYSAYLARNRGAFRP